MGRAKGVDELFYGEDLEHVLPELRAEDYLNPFQRFYHLASSLSLHLRNPNTLQIDQNNGMHLLSEGRAFPLLRLSSDNESIQLALAQVKDNFTLQIEYNDNSGSVIEYRGSSIEEAVAAANERAVKMGLPEESFTAFKALEITNQHLHRIEKGPR